MKNNLLKQLAVYAGGSGLGLIISFLNTIITTRILTPVEYGKASMFTLVLNILVLLVLFGGDQVYVLLFYEEKPAKRGGLLYNCIKVSIIAYIICIAIIILFADQFSNFIYGEFTHIGIGLLIIGILVQVLYSYSNTLIRMQQKAKLYSIMEIAFRFFNIAFLLIYYYLIGGNYKIIAYTAITAYTIIAIIGIFLERKIWTIKNFCVRDLKHTRKEIFSLGYPILLTVLLTWLFQSFDKVAIKTWRDYQELGLYSAAFKIIGLLNAVQTTFTTFWTPVCYETYEKDPNNTAFFLKVNNLLSVLMFGVAIFIIGFKDVIVLFLGKEYVDAAKIMPFLVFMPIMYTISETTVIGINFKKRVKWHIAIAGGACAINIIGNRLLVPIHGALGASISTAISYMAFFYLRTHISSKFYPVNFNLKRLYCVSSGIFMYACISTMLTTIYINVILCLILLSMLVLIYLNEVKVILSYIKSYISIRK